MQSKVKAEEKYQTNNSVRTLSSQVLHVMSRPSFKELSQIDIIVELDRYMHAVECIYKEKKK